MPGGRPTSRLDPIPASHTPLTGSEAAVPGEKRGPGAAQPLRRPAHKDFHRPRCLKDLLGREREREREGVRTVWFMGEGGGDLSHFTPQ